MFPSRWWLTSTLFLFNWNIAKVTHFFSFFRVIQRNLQNLQTLDVNTQLNIFLQCQLCQQRTSKELEVLEVSLSMGLLNKYTRQYFLNERSKIWQTFFLLKMQFWFIFSGRKGTWIYWKFPLKISKKWLRVVNCNFSLST